MKYKVGESVYLDCMTHPKMIGWTFSGYVKIRKIELLPGNDFRLFFDGTPRVSISNTSKQFHRVKTISDMRRIKIEKIKKRIADDV